MADLAEASTSRLDAGQTLGSTGRVESCLRNLPTESYVSRRSARLGCFGALYVVPPEVTIVLVC